MIRECAKTNLDYGHYKGKFDDGWDKYRERIFAKQKAHGWIPQNAVLTPRPATLASWDSITGDEKPFQRRAGPHPTPLIQRSLIE